MQQNSKIVALIFGVFLFLGLTSLGYLLAGAAIDVKLFDRSVTVKGLSEREYIADIVIWPIQFTAAGNDLESLYNSIDENTARIEKFLTDKGVDTKEVTFTSPAINDKSAQLYGNDQVPAFRYTAMQIVTVYSENIELVRSIMGSLSELGKQGIVFTGTNYQFQTEYIFTRLNEVKPEMVDEATRKAREVAEKFAENSNSKLGKIKRATQGQFTISSRDNNNPHIKKVRVVSTVEFYLSD